MQAVNKVNRFGWTKFHNKPSTGSDWEKVFARHEYLLPSVERLSLRLSRRGPRLAGLRRFRFDVLPAIEHHNSLAAEVSILSEEQNIAEIVVAMRDGSSHTLDCTGKRDADILNSLYALDPDANQKKYRSEAEQLLMEKASANKA